MAKLADILTAALARATKEFTTAKRRAAAQNRDSLTYDQLIRLQEKKTKRDLAQTLRSACEQIMPQAYAKASEDGRLPANARQIMYAARPLVLALTGGKCWKGSDYFTQTLLNHYLSEHAEQTSSWNVVYDARGHLVEPHVIHRLGLGTLEVGNYVRSWNQKQNSAVHLALDELYPTRGPVNRFGAALFVEKEGFDELLVRSEIAARWDIAIFSSKGMSPTACRMLVEHLSNVGVTILVAHDFDLSGLTIAYTLGHSTKRYQFKTTPKVCDIGLRLADVRAMNLQSEPVEIKQRKDPRDKFRGLDISDDYNGDYDLTDEELNFLVERRSDYKTTWTGKRVELNAMTSRELIDWLERKFEEHGVGKIVPDAQTLKLAWHRAQRIAKINQAIAKINQDKNVVDVPRDLERRVRTLLEKKPTLSWDRALAEIASKE